ncbi:type II polyketide synthase, beta-ketoacyl synthase domain-containing protein [Nocardia nova SH22a]|uniref:Type II polyketide synthase, beta-ketoacyl synthase domain-containing protein n=1 Tax=Nocardia nova SH22a TaxID=1415166 RepID=W5TA95_9NOCA|nr:beta-ketoacyl-[acyl-carrier-protein] synthase family protein [Nocardia nova]AHH15888.1 type II polyketide synthase, beta-ketoacyl synthase domain-containing protein [Nocardia nova SH22a]
MSDDRRVVVTGIGVVAPGTPGRKNFWNLISGGRTATRRMTLVDPEPFRSQVAAEVDFDPLLCGLSPAETARMDRVGQFALVAAREALVDSGLEFDRTDPCDTGVVVGTAVGSTPGLETEYVRMSDHGRLWEVNERAASPNYYSYYIPSSIAAELALEVDARGPVSVVSSGCTSGLDAVAHAVDLVREGTVERAVCGASDAPISPITIACFDAIKATTPRLEDPERASRPFDLSRNGFVLGEGAAMFVIEEMSAAVRRGVPIYGEISGFAGRCNAHHMTGLRPDGVEMADAITSALHRARLDPTDIGYINAHGSGTKQNDRHETAAFKRALGDHAYATPISSIKSMVGHSLGAIGSIEIAACLLTLTNDLVPPTANWNTRDPQCDLDYVPGEARPAALDHILTVGSGFGGFQSAMVISRAGAR